MPRMASFPPLTLGESRPRFAFSPTRPPLSSAYALFFAADFDGFFCAAGVLFCYR